MSHLNRPRLAVLGALILAALLSSRDARAQKPPDVVVNQSIQAMSEVTRNPKTGMPRLVMREAQGIAIVPSMFKAGFVIGARFGRGLLMVRLPDGTWSNPVFIHLVGGSFGAQIGAQKTDLILVFQTQRGLDRFIKGRDKLTLGVDVGVAAGPAGRRFEAGTDVALKSEILSYSNSRGVFAGVSAEGGTLAIDWRANMNFYGRPVAVNEILAMDSPLPIPINVVTLQDLLAEKTASPIPVVPGRIVEGETIIMEDDEFEDEVPVRRRRPRVVRPELLDEDEDDLDPLPPARSTPRSTRPNDEDLPSAVPDPRPARPENQSSSVRSEPRPKAKVEPRPRAEIDDDIPELAPPKR